MGRVAVTLVSEKRCVGMALVAAVTGGIAFGISRHVLPVVYPKMEAMLGTGSSDLGYMTTAYFVSYTISVFLSGYLSDRVGSRNVIGISCLISAVGTFLVGFCSTLPVLLVMSVIIGFGAGGIFVPLVSWILRSFQKGKGSIISAILVGEGSLGISVGFLSPVIIGLYSWSHVWWYFGTLLSILAILLWWLIRDKTPETRDSRSTGIEVNDRSISSVLGLPRIRNLGLVYLLHGLTRGVVVTFSVMFMVNRGVEFGSASKAFSCIAMGFIPGAIFSGVMSDKFGARLVLRVLLVFEAASIGLLMFSGSLNLIFLLYITIGFCLTGIPTVMNTFPPEISNEEIYGKVVGVLSLMYNVGAASSPAFGGYLGDVTGSLIYALGFGFVVVLIAMAIAFVKI